MSDGEWLELDAALERLRAVRGEIGDAHAGVASIHLDATIEALESQLQYYRRNAA